VNWGTRLAYIIMFMAVSMVITIILIFAQVINNELYAATQGIANSMVSDGLPASIVTNPSQIDGIGPSTFTGGINLLSSFLSLAVPIIIVIIIAILMYSERR
jgi:ABC-type multidrug transport system permease subunit